MSKSQLASEFGANGVPKAPDSPSYMNLKTSSLVPPLGSRFIMKDAENPRLTLEVLSMDSLVLQDDKSIVYVRIRQGGNKMKTPQAAVSEITSSSLSSPLKDHVCDLSIHNPLKELLLIEVYERDKLGRKSLLGYTPIDLTLLPDEQEVKSTEKLSGGFGGSITIKTTAHGFGLENVDAEYIKQYVTWRGILLPVDRQSNRSATTSSPLVGRTATVNSTTTSSPALSRSVDDLKRRVPGPYGGKNVAEGFIVENGYVKKEPSAVDQAAVKVKEMMRGVNFGVQSLMQKLKSSSTKDTKKQESNNKNKSSSTNSKAKKPTM